jgi:hypothetical protein
LNSTVSVLALVLGLLLSILAATGLIWAAWRYLRLASFKAAGEISDRQDKVIDQLRKQIQNLERMASMQEKRLNRAEIESQRKERLLMNARQEIEYFEDIVRLLLPIIEKLAPADKKKVDAVLKQIAVFRQRSARENVEWEETKDVLSIYLDGHRLDGGDEVL